MPSPESANVEPLLPVDDLYAAYDQALPLRGVNLAGLKGGMLRSRDVYGVGRYLQLRELEPGDDISDRDIDASAESPLEPPVGWVREGTIRPTLWLATDMLREDQGQVDGYFDKRSLALATTITILRTAANGESRLPMALVGANDRTVAAERSPRSGKYHVVEMISELLELGQPELPLPPIEQRPLLSDMLGYLGNVAKRSVVVTISDFRGPHVHPDSPRDNWHRAMAELATLGNELVAIEVVGPEDLEMPARYQQIVGSAHNRSWVGRFGVQSREAYARGAQLQQAEINAVLADVGAIHLRLSTDDPKWYSSLNDQLRYPEKRVAAESLLT